jgi:hypothetical protein
MRKGPLDEGKGWTSRTDTTAEKERGKIIKFSRFRHAGDKRERERKYSSFLTSH